MKNLGYFGGKYFLKEWIIQNLDFGRTAYLEPFAGSAVVLLYKPRHKIEIINDYNQDIANLFYCLKEKYDEFMKEAEYLVNSRAWFVKFRDELNESVAELGDVKRAIKYLFVLRTSVSGYMRAWSLSYRNQKKIVDPEFFKFIHDRLQNVFIDNRDFREVIENALDVEDICIYADPPYYGREHHYKGFSREDHYVLAELLNKAKGYVVLSYYYFDEMEKLYPPSTWKYLTKNAKIFCNTQVKKRQNSVEYLLIKGNKKSIL